MNRRHPGKRVYFSCQGHTGGWKYSRTNGLRFCHVMQRHSSANPIRIPSRISR